MKYKIRRQPPVKGGRVPGSHALLQTIEAEVERLAKIHGVSRSWVIATVLADAFRIKEQPSFYGERKLRRIT